MHTSAKYASHRAEALYLQLTPQPTFMTGCRDAKLVGANFASEEGRWRTMEQMETLKLAEVALGPCAL